MSATTPQFPAGPVPSEVYETAKRFVSRLTPIRRANREAMLAWAGHPDGIAREVAIQVVIHSAAAGIARECWG